MNAKSEYRPCFVASNRRRCTGQAKQYNMKTYTHAPHGGITRVVLALAWAGSCAFAQAEQKASETTSATPAKTVEETELPPITVSAHDGLSVPYDQTGVSVTVLDSEKLQKEGVQTLTDALTRVPGAYVLPGGGGYQYGNISKLVIRGMNDPNYNLTMVDGMRLYRPQLLNPTANFLGQSMLFTLGNTEVVKGAQGAVYGGGAVGGLVSSETPQGTEDGGVKIFSEYGSYDTYNGYITAQDKKDQWDYFFAAGYNRTNNDINCLPYTVPAKHQGKFTQWEEALRLGRKIGDNTKISFTYRRQDAQYNMRDTSEATDYTYKTNLATVKAESKINKLWTSSLMAGYYGWDPTFGDDETMGGKQTHVNMRNVQLEWRNALHWNESNTTTAGFSWYRSQYRSEWEAKNLENIYSFFAEHRIKPVSYWDNSFAVRLDQSTVWNELFTFRYATSWKVTGDKSKTRLYGSVGSGYRSPTQFERYADYAVSYNWGGWESVANYKGNPDLKVERSLSGDAGIEQQIAKDHYVSVTGFWTRLEHQIEYAYTPDWSTTWANGSHATSVGAELALRGKWGDAWKTGYSVAYTYTEAKNSQDRQLNNTARNVWSAEIHTSPTESITTGLGLIAASGRTGDNLRMDNYCVLRWFAQWKATENLTFHLRAENLLDDRYETVSGTYGPAYISAGASVYGGITLTF